MFGFKPILSKRRTKQEYEEALTFISHLPSEKAVFLDKALDWTLEHISEISKPSNISNIRKLLANFTDWYLENPTFTIVENNPDKEDSNCPKQKRIQRTAYDYIKVLQPKQHLDNLPKKINFEKLEEMQVFFKQYEAYWRDTFRGDRLEKTLSTTTLNNNIKAHKSILEWIAQNQGIPEKDVTVDILFPKRSSKADYKKHKERDFRYSRDIIIEYLRWYEVGRQATPVSLLAKLSPLVSVIKFYYKDFTDREIYQKFEDILILVEVRRMSNQLSSKKGKKNKQYRGDIVKAKYEDVLEAVKRLESLTSIRTFRGDLRKEGTIHNSWMRYALVALIAYIPRRSGVFERLEIGRTLRKIQGKWTLTLWEPGSYKTYDTYGDQTIPIKPDWVEELLDKWITEHRPYYQPNHNFVFLTTKRDSKTGKCGQKIGRGAINVIVGSAVSNATNKYCTPQLIRSAIVEFYKDKDAYDETLESLAW